MDYMSGIVDVDTMREMMSAVRCKMMSIARRLAVCSRRQSCARRRRYNHKPTCRALQLTEYRPEFNISIGDTAGAERLKAVAIA